MTAALGYLIAAGIGACVVIGAFLYFNRTKPDAVDAAEDKVRKL